MLYAALTLWLLVIVFSAWGVHWLWSQMIKPRAVNTVLLPGTLIAQLGHVLGLLITGNSVRNTSLMGDDEKGEPTTDSPDRQRIPVIGPVLVGLLPLVACAACLYLAARTLGREMLVEGASPELPQALPLTLAGLWELLRTSITVTENMLNAILSSDLMNWANVLFLYLAVCLTVRMAPFEGNRRGAIGAILLSGLVIGLVASLVSAVEGAVRSSWPILNFAVGVLLFLLLVSLLMSGLVGLVRILARNE
ncbi:MAG: hypothetical protein ACE5I3_12885 [Phycisphaerae bacterium]